MEAWTYGLENYDGEHSDNVYKYIEIEDELSKLDRELSQMKKFPIQDFVHSFEVKEMITTEAGEPTSLINHLH